MQSRVSRTGITIMVWVSLPYTGIQDPFQDPFRIEGLGFERSWIHSGGP